jgi:hypothetical protein
VRSVISTMPSPPSFRPLTAVLLPGPNPLSSTRTRSTPFPAATSAARCPAVCAANEVLLFAPCTVPTAATMQHGVKLNLSQMPSTKCVGSLGHTVGVINSTNLKPDRAARRPIDRRAVHLSNRHNRVVVCSVDGRNVVRWSRGRLQTGRAAARNQRVTTHQTTIGWHPSGLEEGALAHRGSAGERGGS